VRRPDKPVASVDFRRPTPLSSLLKPGSWALSRRRTGAALSGCGLFESWAGQTEAERSTVAARAVFKLSRGSSQLGSAD